MASTTKKAVEILESTIAMMSPRSLGSHNRNLERQDSSPLGEKPVKLECCCRRFCKAPDYNWNPRELHLRLKNSRRDRFAYLIDRILSKRWAFFLALLLWGFFQVVLGGICWTLVWRYDPVENGGEERRPEADINPFFESIWDAWTFMADPGTHSGAYETDQRVVSSLITLGGILFFASILGVTVDMVREKMDSLRQGKSRIIEKDHTLILGWTEKTIHIIEELCSANESEGGGVVAVLAPENKAQMELDLELQLPFRQRKGTRIVFRSGSPLVLTDLIRVSVHQARAIIILAATGNADAADSDTLRTMLSLRSLIENLRGHVLAEVRDIDNEPLVRLVGGSVVETLVSHDVIGRLMLMSVRQPGLAKVYEALLGFDGDEFYMETWPELEGVIFGELPERFPAAIPLGVRTAEGTMMLRPNPQYQIKPGDSIIVIAEDNDTYCPEESLELPIGTIPEAKIRPQGKEKILFCGWRRDIRDILMQLDKIAKAGTEIHMMTHCVPINQRNAKLLEDGMDVRELRNLKLVHHFGNTSVRRKLDLLPMEQFTSCMIFADQAFEADTLRADSHSLATLLLIRDIQALRMTSFAGEEINSQRLLRTLTDLSPAQQCPIICEVLDPHTQKTIASNRHLSLTSDFCQTNKLIAQVLAMVAEERTVNTLFEELLGNTGCDIAVVHSSRYCHEGELVCFLTIAKRAQRFNETLVGYQLQHSIEKTVLNPPDKLRPCAWDSFDFAILRGESRKPSKSGSASLDGIAEVKDALESFVAAEQRAAVREDLMDQLHSGPCTSESEQILPSAEHFNSAPAQFQRTSENFLSVPAPLQRSNSKDGQKKLGKSWSGQLSSQLGAKPAGSLDELTAACAAIRDTPKGSIQFQQIRNAVDKIGNAVDMLRQALSDPIHSLSPELTMSSPRAASNLEPLMEADVEHRSSDDGSAPTSPMKGPEKSHPPPHKRLGSAPHSTEETPVSEEQGMLDSAGTSAVNSVMGRCCGPSGPNGYGYLRNHSSSKPPSAVPSTERPPEPPP